MRCRRRRRASVCPDHRTGPPLPAMRSACAVQHRGHAATISFEKPTRQSHQPPCKCSRAPSLWLLGRTVQTQNTSITAESQMASACKACSLEMVDFRTPSSGLKPMTSSNVLRKEPQWPGPLTPLSSVPHRSLQSAAAASCQELHPPHLLDRCTGCPRPSLPTPAPCPAQGTGPQECVPVSVRLLVPRVLTENCAFL